MEYILAIFSFFMTCFAINPHTWNNRKKALNRITPLGYIILLIAFLILTGAVAKINTEKREKVELQKMLESITETQLKQLNISLAKVYEIKEIYLPLDIIITSIPKDIIENSQLIEAYGAFSLSKDVIYDENNLHVNFDIKADKEGNGLRVKWYIPMERLQIQNLDSFKYLWITLNIKLPYPSDIKYDKNMFDNPYVYTGYLSLSAINKIRLFKDFDNDPETNIQRLPFEIGLFGGDRLQVTCKYEIQKLLKNMKEEYLNKVKNWTSIVT